MTASSSDPPARLLRRREVEELVGLGRSALYQKMARGMFPKPVHLTHYSVRWVEAEVTRWIAEQVSRRDGGGL